MAKDTTIVRAAIHPGIGVARVGNSPSEFFIGPEVPYPEPQAAYKDANGAIIREAARFRVYGYNKNNEVVGELNADNADVSWSVRVVNTKAAWYDFDHAMDLSTATPVARRNPSIVGEERKKLVIDSGTHTIEGRDIHGASYQLDSGKFFAVPVSLGELRTDNKGRLLVLASHGTSGTIVKDNPIGYTLNNSGWYDSMGDGPVHALVTYNGKELPVKPAWVMTTLPNYGPQMIPTVTMNDVMVDLFTQNRMFPNIKVPSFSRHIYPLFYAFSLNQWTSLGWLQSFGEGAPYDFTEGTMIARLADASCRNASFRRQIFNYFRSPTYDNNAPQTWPWLYGDDATGSPPFTPREFLAVPQTQYNWLSAWAQGNFISDFTPDWQGPHRLKGYPVAEQPEILDRAAMTHVMGQGFQPSLELTFNMRSASIYTEPYRLRQRHGGPIPMDYGSVLRPDVYQVEGGIVDVGPGDLTSWLSLPWVSDTANCRGGYYSEYDPYLPVYWPQRAPNQVLTQKAYDIIMDPNTTRKEKLDAFQTRMDWWRGLTGDVPQNIQEMQYAWPRMGIVVEKPGPKGVRGIPRKLYVETGFGFKKT